MKTQTFNCSPGMPQRCLHAQLVSLYVFPLSEQQLAEGNRVSKREASGEVNAHRHSPALAVSLFNGYSHCHLHNTITG